jgi:NAD(P)-dependent dehydrogenase (short-subunit alcohol dehydrogenase family)
VAGRRRKIESEIRRIMPMAARPIVHAGVLIVTAAGVSRCNQAGSAHEDRPDHRRQPRHRPRPDPAVRARRPRIAVCRQPAKRCATSTSRVRCRRDRRRRAAALAQRLGGERIGILVLNAGIAGQDALGQIGSARFDAMQRQFESTLGPLRVAQAARPARRGREDRHVTSRMGSVAGTHLRRSATTAPPAAVTRSANRWR